MGVTRGTPGPSPLKAQNCVSLRTTSATRIVSGNVTATWSPTGPASERLGLHVHFERRPAGRLDAEGPSPLALVLSGFESPDPSDRLFLFVEFPPGDSSAGAQAVRLTVDFEYLGGEIEPEGPKVCNVPSEP